MRPSEYYQGTVVDLDGQDGVSFVTVPSSALVNVEVLLDSGSVAEALDLIPRYISDSPSSLIYMLTAILVAEGGPRAEEEIFRLTEIAADRLWERVGPNAVEFAEHVAYASVVPFRESPLSLMSLATIAKAGAKAGAVGIGFAVGLAAGYGSVFVLVTVPAGIVLCGAAVAVAKALQEGLSVRLTRLLKGDPMPPSRARTPTEKIVASVRPKK